MSQSRNLSAQVPRLNILTRHTNSAHSFHIILFIINFTFFILVQVRESLKKPGIQQIWGGEIKALLYIIPASLFH
jgi:hypothetical protein